MKYIGKLYGKVGGKTFDTGKTSQDWDDMEDLIKQKSEHIKQSYDAWAKENTLRLKYQRALELICNTKGERWLQPFEMRDIGNKALCDHQVTEKSVCVACGYIMPIEDSF